MISNRSAGILLHISSLPGEYGIGTMGKEAYGFVRLLSRKISVTGRSCLLFRRATEIRLISRFSAVRGTLIL